LLVVCIGGGCRNGKLNFRIHKEDSLRDIFYYYESINNMNTNELKNEYKKRETVYFKEKSSEGIIKYALIMILPWPEFHNSHKAIDILDELIRKDEKDPYRSVAILIKDVVTLGNKKEVLYEETNRKLDDVISERKKQDILFKEMNDKFNLMVEENEKKDNLNKKLHDELATKKQTVEKLQKKIEKLKAIEKSINERKNTKEPTT
jgi:hypothetical protein